MGTGDKMLGGNLRWNSIPSRGSSNTPCQQHAMETGISSSSVGQLLSRVRLYFFFYMPVVIWAWLDVYYSTCIFQQCSAISFPFLITLYLILT